MLKSLSIKSTLALIIALVFVIPGCSDNSASATKPAPVVKTAAKTSVEEKKSEYDFPYEVYGDPETWSTPRLQFVWRHFDEERHSVWSMRMDGTDVRRVVGPKELENAPGKDYRMTFLPRRSPNNRYLAVEIDDDNDEGHSSYIIYDLKTKTKKVYFMRGMDPDYNWTKDSRHVYFFADRKFWKYDVTNESFTEKKRLTTAGLYLIDNDTKFLSVMDRGFNIYDLKLNLLKEVELPQFENLQIRRGTSISSEGEYLILLGEDGRYTAIFEINSPHRIIFSNASNEYHISGTVFMPGGKKLVGDFSDRKGHSQFDLEKQTFMRFENVEIPFYKRLSLINHPLHNTGQAEK